MEVTVNSTTEYKSVFLGGGGGGGGGGGVGGSEPKFNFKLIHVYTEFLHGLKIKVSLYNINYNDHLSVFFLLIK